MSATPTASSPARRVAAAPAARAVTPAARPPAPAPRAFALAAAGPEEELRLNLRDLPRADAGLDVDGFRPSLLSRLLDLLSPLPRR